MHKKFSFYLFLSLIYFQSLESLAGKEGISGGGQPNKALEREIFSILKDENLMSRLAEYIRTFDSENISDQIENGLKIRTQINRLKENDIFLSNLSKVNLHIEQGWCPKLEGEKKLKKSPRPQNRTKIGSQSPQNNNFPNSIDSNLDPDLDKAMACTVIGGIGRSIFFKIPDIAREFSSLSSEQWVPKLIGLILHEHIHQIQNPNDNFEFKNEYEANLIVGYLLLNTKIERNGNSDWVFYFDGTRRFKKIFKFYNKGNSNAAYFRLSEDLDYQLHFEICLPRDIVCHNIVNGTSINSFEAWTYIDYQANKETLKNSSIVVGSIIPTIFTASIGTLAIGAVYSVEFGIARLLALNAPLLPSESEFIAFGAGFGLAADGSFIKSLTEDNVPQYKYFKSFFEAPPNKDSKTLIVELSTDEDISFIVSQFKAFIQSVPKMNRLSPAVLKQWENQD